METFPSKATAVREDIDYESIPFVYGDDVLQPTEEELSIISLVLSEIFQGEKNSRWKKVGRTDGLRTLYACR